MLFFKHYAQLCFICSKYHAILYQHNVRRDNQDMGKTTALQSGLSLLGAHEQRFFSRGTTEKYSIHCCESSFPIGCDDPLSEVQTGQLVVDLYNGAKVTTVKRGDMKPLSTAVVSANFTMTAKAR